MAINCKELPTLRITVSLQIFTLHQSFTLCYFRGFLDIYHTTIQRHGSNDMKLRNRKHFFNREKETFRQKVKNTPFLQTKHTRNKARQVLRGASCGARD